jgi:hypothetical protein
MVAPWCETPASDGCWAVATALPRKTLQALRGAGMRDVLIHQDMGVDLEVVWDVSQTKL